MYGRMPVQASLVVYVLEPLRPRTRSPPLLYAVQMVSEDSWTLFAPQVFNKFRSTVVW